MAGTLNFGPIEKIKKKVSYNIKRSLHAKFGWNPLNATDRPTDRPTDRNQKHLNPVQGHIKRIHSLIS